MDLKKNQHRTIDDNQMDRAKISSGKKYPEVKIFIDPKPLLVIFSEVRFPRRSRLPWMKWVDIFLILVRAADFDNCQNLWHYKVYDDDSDNCT